MKITEVETLRLGQFGNVVWVLIRTDENITGLGETFLGASAVEAYIHETVAPKLIGRDPLQIEAINRDLIGYLGWRGAGVETRGNSAIDIALWDILGKSLDQPIWRLLGGRMRERMPAYASGGWAPAESIADQLGGYIAKGGFGAVKMRVGAGDGDVGTSIRRVRAAREGLGDAVDIMCDSHGTMSLSEAKRFCREALNTSSQ